MLCKSLVNPMQIHVNPNVDLFIYFWYLKFSSNLNQHSLDGKVGGMLDAFWVGGYWREVG